VKSVVSKAPTPFAHINWPLWIGSVLVIGVLVVAVIGPELAPRDPLKENLVIQIGEVFVAAPFAPMAVPGFPLGSDNRGRDLLSMLLWAVRPTLILVAFVAAIRLGLGVLIGLCAGWWTTGWAGRALESLLSAALAAPVLIVALAVITLIGLEAGQGVWAFGMGLALTGWAETARVVREEARRARQQNFIEAARALGASDHYILTRHIFPHVLPLVWVMAAFEISNTLLTLASLGFLGYYTNDVWIMISDVAAERFGGKPDLGQLLATVTTDIITGPWKMFAAGSAVFLIVLAFNLLGAGLRRTLETAHTQRPAWMTRLDGWATTPAGDRMIRRGQGIVAVTGLALVGGWLGMRYTASPASRALPPVLPIPGNHLWATERHDPYGTLWADVVGPRTTPTLAWTFTSVGLSGGPAIAADGTVYVGTLDPALVALDPTGPELWRAALPAAPIGTPALGADGTVYAALADGRLIALEARGQTRWIATPTDLTLQASGGPIVAPDGTIYYTLQSRVQAVQADGQLLWRNVAYRQQLALPPRLSPAQDLVYLYNLPLEARTGETRPLDMPLRPDQYLNGADGQNYMRLENTLSEWVMTTTGPSLVGTYPWQVGGSAVGLPNDAGVTRNGTLWLGYLGAFQDSRFVWLDKRGTTLREARFPDRPSRLIGLDRDNVAYFCGSRTSTSIAECFAYAPTASNALWLFSFAPTTAPILGGAVIDDRLYVALGDGGLYALEALK
jgi:peptide/nickel transport system permease protein